MRPILFEIGDYIIYPYPVAMSVALLVAVLLIARFAKQQGYDYFLFFEGVLLSEMVGLAGARLVYVSLNLDYYLANLDQIFRLTYVGFSVHGAILFSLLAAILWCRWRKVNFLDMADLMMPYYAVGYAIVRTFGCFLSGCCYGKVSALPWAVVMVKVDNQPRHPVQLYAAAGVMILYLLYKWYYQRRHFPGANVLLMLASYGLLRFTCEFFREGDSLPLLLGLSLAQLVSMGLFILSSAVFLAVLAIRRRNTQARGQMSC